MADYINREALKNRLSESLDEARKVPSQAHWKTGLLRAMFLLQSTPSADVVDVVRCKDCKHRYKSSAYEHERCDRLIIPVLDDDFFCKWGEKRETD